MRASWTSSAVCAQRLRLQQPRNLRQNQKLKAYPTLRRKVPRRIRRSHCPASGMCRTPREISCCTSADRAQQRGTSQKPLLTLIGKVFGEIIQCFKFVLLSVASVGCGSVEIWLSGILSYFARRQPLISRMAREQVASRAWRPILS